MTVNTRQPLSKDVLSPQLIPLFSKWQARKAPSYPIAGAQTPPKPTSSTFPMSPAGPSSNVSSAISKARGPGSPFSSSCCLSYLSDERNLRRRPFLILITTESIGRSTPTASMRRRAHTCAMHLSSSIPCNALAAERSGCSFTPRTGMCW